MSLRVSIHDCVALNGGWHLSEPTGVWSSARNALLSIRSNAAVGPSKFVLSLSFSPEMVRPQVMRAWMGQYCLADLLIDNSSGNHIEIPLYLSERHSLDCIIEIRLYISSLTKSMRVDGSREIDYPVGVWLNDVWAEADDKAKCDEEQGDELAAMFLQKQLKSFS